MSEESLSTLRDAIDKADDALLRALAARLQVVRVIGAVKRQAGVAPIDPNRESDLTNSWRARAVALRVPPDLAEALLATILRHTREVVSGEVDELARAA